jgi:ADP-ribose pyrophosphatase YjhB (NUDIX family)
MPVPRLVSAPPPHDNAAVPERPPPPPLVSGNFERKVPEGDTLVRRVCADCGWVDYENPKIVVGSVCYWGELILLCRRAINPRAGFWTLPAGYLELHETTVDGARREAWEEARAQIDIDGLLAVYNVPRLSQVQLIYRARLTDPNVAAGPESTEVGLFEWNAIPWAEIAFPSVHWALGHFAEVRGEANFAARTNPPGEVGEITAPSGL